MNSFSASVTAGILAYAISAIRRGEILSKYALVDGLEIALSAGLGDFAVSFLPVGGIVGLTRELASDALAGVFYMAMRLWIQKNPDGSKMYPDESKLKNFGYGFALSYAGAALVAPAYTALAGAGMYVNINMPSVSSVVGSSAAAEEISTRSNVEFPPGSGVPAWVPTTTGGSSSGWCC